MFRRLTRIHHRTGDAVACSSLIVVVCLFCFAQPAHAGIAWSGNVDPADPATWTSDTTGYIGKTANGTITVDGGSDLLSDSSYIGNESGAIGAVTVDGAGSTWTNSGIHLQVGNQGSGTLTVQNDGLVTADGALIVNPYSTGSKVMLNDGFIVAQAVFAAEDDLEGTGTIDTQGWCYDFDRVISQAGDLQHQLVLNSLPDQNVTVNIDLSAGAGRIGAGYAGTATLTVQNGVSLSSNRGYIGYQAGAVGTITVEGAGTTWTDNGEFFQVGFQGEGTLNIRNQASLSTTGQNCFIGSQPGSNGTINIEADSIWTHSHNLSVGHGGNGTLNIGGAVVVTEDTRVSPYSDLSGTLHLDNGTLTTGSLFCTPNDLTGTGAIDTHGLVSDIDLVFDATHGLNQTLNIGVGQNVVLNLAVDGTGSIGAGFGGVGTTSISDGIVVGSTFGHIGYRSGSMGEVTVDGAGSTWINSRDLCVGNSGDGTLNVTGGGTVDTVHSIIGLWSSSTGEATVDGTGSAWTHSGVLYVGYYGNSTLNIMDGGLVSVAGDMVIDFNGDNGSVINMVNGGMLALAGDADDSIADFLGLVDGTDRIQYWDDSISDWANINGAANGDDYTLSYLDGYTVLTMSVPEPAIIGDANRDGTVDADDAAVLAKYWLTASGAFWGMGDFNDDGAVDDIDATLMAANWGTGANAAVPEPSTFVGLMGLCLAGLLAAARRKRLS